MLNMQVLREEERTHAQRIQIENRHLRKYRQAIMSVLMLNVQVLREEERTHARRSHRVNEVESQDWRRRAGLDSVFRRTPSHSYQREPLSFLRDLGLVTLGAVFATALWSCWSWLRPPTLHRRKPSIPSGGPESLRSFLRGFPSCSLPQRQSRSWGPAVQHTDPWERRGSWQGGGYGGHGSSPLRSPTPTMSSKLLMQPAAFTKPESPPTLRSLAS